MSSERGMWRRLVELTRETQWLLPLLGAIAGVLLALAVGLSEASPDKVNWTLSISEGRGALLSWLSILFAAFSIVLALATLTVQNVISKFSLRMYRLYERDLRDRYVLALFAMTAAYIITEQILLRTASPNETVPTTGFVVAFVLLVATGITLIWYITSVTRWFRVDRVARRVVRGALTAARVSDVLRDGTGPAADGAFDRPAHAVPITASRSGYLVEPDPRDVLSALADSSSTAVIARFHGSPVVAGEEVGWVAASDPPATGITDAAGRVAHMLETEPDRGVVGSVAYGIVVLADTAIMALSPAVNDPNTAVQIVEEMTFLFEGLSGHRLGSYEQRAPASTDTVVVRSRSFDDYLRLGTDQVVLYGQADPFVVGALERMAVSLSSIDLSEDDRAAVGRFKARLSSLKGNVDGAP